MEAMQIEAMLEGWARGPSIRTWQELTRGGGLGAQLFTVDELITFMVLMQLQGDARFNIWRERPRKSRPYPDGWPDHAGVSWTQGPTIIAVYNAAGGDRGGDGHLHRCRYRLLRATSMLMPWGEEQFLTCAHLQPATLDAANAAVATIMKQTPRGITAAAQGLQPLRAYAFDQSARQDHVIIAAGDSAIARAATRGTEPVVASPGRGQGGVREGLIFGSNIRIKLLTFNGKDLTLMNKLRKIVQLRHVVRALEPSAHYAPGSAGHAQDVADISSSLQAVLASGPSVPPPPPPPQPPPPSSRRSTQLPSLEPTQNEALEERKRRVLARVAGVSLEDVAGGSDESLFGRYKNRKIRFGKRGGAYIIKHGRKEYIKD